MVEDQTKSSQVLLDFLAVLPVLINDNFVRRGAVVI